MELFELMERYCPCDPLMPQRVGWLINGLEVDKSDVSFVCTVAYT
jgi:hypothetical protein